MAGDGQGNNSLWWQAGGAQLQARAGLLGSIVSGLWRVGGEQQGGSRAESRRAPGYSRELASSCNCEFLFFFFGYIVL